MKKILISTIALSMSLLSVKAQVSKKGQKKKTVSVNQATPVKQLSPEEEQKIWMEYATPNEMHKLFTQSEGSWQVETKQWLMPDAEPLTSNGKCTNTLAMDGRYEISHFEAEMMGMPFKGMSVTGFDNAMKEFKTTWIDNFGTGIMMLTGKWNEKKRCIDYVGTMVDPTVKKEVNIRQTYSFIGDNEIQIEMFMINPKTKSEYKSMEIKFKRQ